MMEKEAEVCASSDCRFQASFEPDESKSMIVLSDCL